MKATGIVRRIDELGRIVIPKEIRRTQRIRQGDPLEIFTTSEGDVIFKKYSPMAEISSVAEQYAAVLSHHLKLTAFVTDRDVIVAAAGSGKKDLQDMRVSRPLERILENRSFYAAQRDGEGLLPCEGCSRAMLAACPVVVAGDAIGVVGVLVCEGSAEPDPEQRCAVELCAALLAKQMEQ